LTAPKRTRTIRLIAPDMGCNCSYAPQPMNLATPKLAQEVVALMSRATEIHGIEQDELQAAEQFNALPIDGSWAYYLLRPDGTVVLHDPPGEPQFVNDQQSLLHAIVYATKRYPSLAKFIPQRPSKSEDCSLCAGTGVRGTYVGTNTPARCPACVGLGWDTSGA